MVLMKILVKCIKIMDIMQFLGNVTHVGLVRIINEKYKDGRRN
jgi:hypothetical protein